MEGDEAVSVDTVFDGFEFVPTDEPKREAAPREEAAEESNAEEPTGEGGEETGEEDNEDSSSEDREEESGSESEGSEEASSEEEGLLDDEELQALEKEIKAEAPFSKTIKAKNGKEEVELAEDIIIPVKVDGRIEEIPLKDLRQSYSSKEHNHRQYRKLENERKQFIQAREEFDGVIKNFALKAGSGEVVPAVMDLIAATGQDPLPIINNIREGLIEQAAELFQMTKEQRQALYKQQAGEYYKQQRDRLLEQQRLQAQREQLEAQISQAVATYGIPDRETFIDTVPKAELYLREAKARGQVSQDVVLTPEMVAKYYQAERLRETFRGVMMEVAPSVKEGSEQWEKFANWVAQNKPPAEKIRAAAKKIFGSNGVAPSKAKQGSPSKPSKPASKAKRLEELASVDPGLDIDATPDLSSFDWRSLG